MKYVLLTVMITAMITTVLTAQAQSKFIGIDANMGNLFRVSGAKSRSISPENVNGKEGRGAMATGNYPKGSREPSRELGMGWKVSPRVIIKVKTTYTVAEIDGSGSIQHIWMTPTGNWRYSILRFYWDDEKEPSVEVPVGDFFCMGWGQYAPLQSLAVCVNPGSAFNCYWPMPFRKKCRITMENIGDKDMALFYQVDYILTKVPSDAGYFHAQFRRVNPLALKTEYVLVDSIKGAGQYVGTYMAWGVNSNAWWGEGEIKFYMDGDKEFPTIAGTGTEDYFCGSYNFEILKKSPGEVITTEYVEFSTPYSGLHQILRGDGHYKVMQRYGLYRWHITDPIHFEKGLKVTIQALGWRDGHRYRPLQDDIASTVFWYQLGAHTPFPPLPGKDGLEVN